MRAIDKKGKNFDDYFFGRLLKSLRKIKHLVDEYYFAESGEDFNKNEKNLIEAMSNHFSLVRVMENCGFYPEDYISLNRHLFLMYQIVGEALYPKSYFDIPLDKYLEKYKYFAHFENYLNQNSKQLSFNFQ